MGGGWFDAESYAKTIESYREALDGLLALCPKVRLHGSGSPSSDPFTTGRFEPLPSAKDHGMLAPYATSVYVRREELFDYARPKPITKRHRLYQDNTFFGVYYTIYARYEVWSWQAGYVGCPGFTDDEGAYHEPVPERPSRMTPSTRRLELRVAGPSISLKRFREKEDQIAEFARLFVDDKRDQILAAYGKQLNEIAKWRKAMKEQSEVLTDI